MMTVDPSAPQETLSHLQVHGNIVPCHQGCFMVLLIAAVINLPDFQARGCGS